MKKINILRKNEDFGNIIENNKSYKSNYYTIFLVPTTNNNYRFGISIGKKVGNAVIRNKIKRQIKNILDIYKDQIKPNYDCIIIVKSNIIDLSYFQIKESLFEVLKKINIFKEN